MQRGKEKVAIYKIQHISGKMYIGSALRLSSRWSEHRKRLEQNEHHSILLQRAWNKYGKDSFKFEIVELIEDKNRLIEREQYWMDYYKSYLPENGYNINPIAGSSFGRKATEERLIKYRITRKGKTPNLNSWKKKISEEDIVSLYKAGKAIQFFIDTYKMAYVTVIKVLKRNNVDIRKRILSKEQISRLSLRMKQTQFKIKKASLNRNMPKLILENVPCQ